MSEDLEVPKPGRRMPTPLLIGLIVGGLVVAAFVIDAITSSDSPDALSSDEIAEVLREMGPVEVEYHLSGTVDSADITIQTPTGISQQSVDVPLRNNGGTFGLHMKFDRGSHVYIAAQKRRSGGTITCQVRVNGRTVSENTSTAAYGIATCSATAR